MFESHKGRFFPGVCWLSTSAADQHTCSSFQLWKSRTHEVKSKRYDCIPNAWALRASGLESCSTRAIRFALGLCCHQNRQMYVKGMSSRLETYRRDQKRLRYRLRTRDPLVLPKWFWNKMEHKYICLYYIQKRSFIVHDANWRFSLNIEK